MATAAMSKPWRSNALARSTRAAASIDAAWGRSTGLLAEMARQSPQARAISSTAMFSVTCSRMYLSAIRSCRGLNPWCRPATAQTIAINPDQMGHHRAGHMPEEQPVEGRPPRRAPSRSNWQADTWCGRPCRPDCAAQSRARPRSRRQFFQFVVSDLQPTLSSGRWWHFHSPRDSSSTARRYGGRLINQPPRAPYLVAAKRLQLHDKEVLPTTGAIDGVKRRPTAASARCAARPRRPVGAWADACVRIDIHSGYPVMTAATR